MHDPMSRPRIKKFELSATVRNKTLGKPIGTPHYNNMQNSGITTKVYPISSVICKHY